MIMLSKKIICIFSLVVASTVSIAQVDVSKNVVKTDVILNPDFISIKANPATPVKNQQNTGTCWSFSTTSFLESESLRSNPAELDLSEMFTVRNIYTEKARNYILRQGKAQFDQGGLGHDVLNAISKYGAMPESAYSGLLPGQAMHDHTAMVSEMKTYLDGILASSERPIKGDWVAGFTAIIDKFTGAAPTNFTYNGQQYTPKTFAADVLKFSPDNYIQLTSFTSQPYYKPFIVQVPDNFSNGAYYNLPLQELIDVVKTAVSNGSSIMWDADVSNNGFKPRQGIALYFDPAAKLSAGEMKADTKEASWTAELREALYEGLITQDDHLMHITGLAKSKGGKAFFVVKNSHGLIGPDKGYINVSEAYFAMNTITLIIPKKDVSKELLIKLQLN